MVLLSRWTRSGLTMPRVCCARLAVAAQALRLGSKIFSDAHVRTPA